MHKRFQEAKELQSSITPPGKWVSPLSAEKLAEKSVTLSQVVVDRITNHVYSSQLLPTEKGRYGLFKHDLASSQHDSILPDPFNARSRVHEYGGLSFTVHNSHVYFVNFSDQLVYHYSLHSSSSFSLPVPLTSPGTRFAELTVTSQGILAIGEKHTSTDKEPQNFLALIHPETGHVKELHTGSDFYAYPSMIERSPTEANVSWITWQHPNMPWNETELWTAKLIHGELCEIEQIATSFSFQQPKWNPTNPDMLVYLSDESGFWNFHTWQSGKKSTAAVCPIQSELGDALWSLGMRTWVFTRDGKIISRVFSSENSGGYLAVFDLCQNSIVKWTTLPFSTFSSLELAGEDGLYCLAASPVLATGLVHIDVTTQECTVLVQGTHLFDTESYISVGKHITFPTTLNTCAHAYFYAPQNPLYSSTSPPPLLVFIHGGPTSSASNVLSAKIQFWTTRGFAVVDVNYRGSTGYGRTYRKALERKDSTSCGHWGVVDVEDCVAAVNYLVQSGQVNAEHVAIRGGSAGGLTTLMALANFPSVFKAGASYYGVSDLLALVTDTHKFESRYLDGLVGELPKFEPEYRKRSPIECLDKFSSPLLVLQGEEDKIVPVNQAEKMVHALQHKGVVVEYVLYPGEQHGFRKAETQIDALNRELAFYLKVFYPNDNDQHE